ncbi:glycosyl transferase group 1 protein, partial [Candidatus Thiomargarita nelsonii]
MGFPEKKIFLGYDAVDNDYFHQGAVRQTQIPKKPYFIAVTRLIKRKNIERLVKAYAVYREKVGVDQAWELVICGSGVEAPAIKVLINEKNITNYVHLPGFISYKEIINWYGLANAFIHPALQEQWGLVVNEACAAGLPILGSRTVGACAELVRDGENGFLFEPTDLYDISD